MKGIPCNDWVRILKPDGWYRDFEEVAKVGQSSVTLKNGDTWSQFRVSAKTSKTIANQRNRRESGWNFVGGEKRMNASQEQERIKDFNPVYEEEMARRRRVGLKEDKSTPFSEKTKMLRRGSPGRFGQNE